MTIRQKIGKYNILISLILALLIGALQSRYFLTVENMITVLRQTSVLGIISCGLMFVLLCGRMDLSISASSSFGSVLFALLVSHDFFNINPVLAILLVIVVCAAIGCLKSILVIYGKIPSVIATLSISSLLQGINYVITDAKIITHLNESIIFLGQGYLWKIPWTIILFIITLVSAGFFLSKTYWGRYFYATGSNSAAAQLAGINVNKIETTAYILCTVLSGFGGIILCCRVKGGQASAGEMYEMRCLTACVVGGISLSGGRGSVLHMLCGVLFVGLCYNIMTMLGLNAYWQNVVHSVLLITAALYDYGHRANINKYKKEY